MSRISVRGTWTPYEKRKMNPHRVKAIEEFAGPSILDAGCGNGAYVLYFSDRFKIQGVDFNSYEAWNEKPDLFRKGNVATLEDWRDDSVDTIVCYETLEHLSSPEKTLKDFFRVCRKNVILTVPNCEITPGMKQSNLLYSHWVDRTHINFFNLDTITEMFEVAGFKIVKSELINKINPLPFVIELFGLNRPILKNLSRRLSVWEKYHHYITCLVVAEKPNL